MATWTYFFIASLMLTLQVCSFFGPTAAVDAHGMLVGSNAGKATQTHDVSAPDTSVEQGVETVASRSNGGDALADEYGSSSLPVDSARTANDTRFYTEADNDVDKRRLRGSKRRLRTSKRRLRFQKRPEEEANQGDFSTPDSFDDSYTRDLRGPRLRASKRRLRFHDSLLGNVDQGDFSIDDNLGGHYNRDLREPRLRYLRKREAASASSSAGESQNVEHLRNKRSVLSDLRDLGEAVQTKRRWSFGNHLGTLTDMVVAEEQRRLAHERELLRQRLRDAGKRSVPSLSEVSAAIGEDTRETAQAKRRWSFGNHLGTLTDMVVAEEQRRLAHERELLRQRLRELGKRADPSLLGDSDILDGDTREAISLLKSALSTK